MTRIFSIILFIGVCSIFPGRGAAQTVSVPLSHWAYDALERWEIQGCIDGVYTAARPITRQEMAEHISDMWKSFEKEPEKISRVDLQQLYHLTLEFQEELEKMPDFQIPSQYHLWSPRLHYLFHRTTLRIFNSILYTNRRNMVTLRHGEFSLFADPVLSYRSQEKMDETARRYRLNRISNGLLFYGHLGSYLGFYFNLTDNHLNDERWQGMKVPFEVWEESGWPYLTRRNSGDFDFDENVAYLTFSYKYLYLTYGREYNQWGVGHVGNPLLSTSAPPYDQIKLILRHWRFKFTHLTAFLQYISPQAREAMKSVPHTNLYWSGNRLDLDLGRGIKVGLSEAIIYGDRPLQLGYVNPLSFFKSAEHFYGDRDNGALGIDFEWRVRDGIKLFGEWFIDDITTTQLGSKWYGNKFGLQGGFFWVNPLWLRDIDLLYEYSRVKPYTYSHSLRDYNKYKHYDTVLGHFIGPNSDLHTLRLRKRFSKFFQVTLEYQEYRHGSNPPDRNVGADPDKPWMDGDATDVVFLDGIRNSQRTYGFSAQYEILRNLFVEAHYRRMKYQIGDWENLVSMQISFNFGYRDESMRHLFPVID